MRDDKVIPYPSTEGAECPFPFYAEVRSAGGVYQIPARPDLFLLTRHADVQYVTDHPEIFSSFGRNVDWVPNEPPVLPSGVTVRTMIEADPPEHTIHRNYVRTPFLPSRIRALTPMITSIADRLIDKFESDGTCDFVADYATLLPAQVTLDVMGIPSSMLEDLHRWGQIEASGAPFLPPERYQRHLDVGKSMQESINVLLRARRETPGDDLLSTLIDDQIERDGEYSEDYVRLQAAVLLAGGVITTAHMLGSTMLLLLEHPSSLAEIIADPALIRPLIEESLRLESPVQWVGRRVLEDVELGQQHIPAGSHVLCGWGAANRDESEFPDPDEFRLDRENAHKHLAFGRGPHFCLGAALARAEATVAFERLFSRLTNFRLVPGADVRRIDSPSFRGLQSLPILFNRVTPGKSEDA